MNGPPPEKHAQLFRRLERPRVNGETTRAEVERLHEASDETLLGWVHEHDTAAFAELYRRHRPDAVRYARRLTRRHRAGDVADDVVAEAVRKVLSALLRGGGPRTGFRPYLFTAIRTVALTHALRPQASLGATSDRTEQGPDHRDDSIIAMAAFASLPERSRRVLWATEALGFTPADVAELLDASPSAVGMMAMRAREALRIAYVRQHLPASTIPACQRSLELLARRAVVVLSPTQSRYLDRHLASCPTCDGAVSQFDLELDEWTRSAGGAAVSDVFRRAERRLPQPVVESA